MFPLFVYMVSLDYFFCISSAISKMVKEVKRKIVPGMEKLTGLSLLLSWNIDEREGTESGAVPGVVLACSNRKDF